MMASSKLMLNGFFSPVRFIRLAINTGASLVPVIGMGGEEGLFDLIVTTPTCFLPLLVFVSLASF